MIQKESIKDMITSYLRNLPLSLRKGEKIAGIMVICRTNQRVWMLQETSFFAPINKHDFSLDVSELSEKIYRELLGFAVTKKEIFFGQSLVRLPKDLLDVAAFPIHSAVANTKLDGTLAKRNINYLIDAMCFTERDLKTILCVADVERIMKQLYSFNVPVGILKNPETKVMPKNHKNDALEIFCQYLAA